MSAPGTESPASLLVVEDEPELADMYATWLRNQYEVEVAYGGEPALEALVDQSFDAVVLDRLMPDLSGDAVLVSLRDRGYEMPVVMATAVDPTTDIIGMDIDDYLQKPISRTELLDTVERLVQLDSVETVAKRLSTLRVKRNVLRIELSEAERDSDPEYAGLLREIEALERLQASYIERVAD